MWVETSVSRRPRLIKLTPSVRKGMKVFLCDVESVLDPQLLTLKREERVCLRSDLDPDRDVVFGLVKAPRIRTFSLVVGVVPADLLRGVALVYVWWESERERERERERE